LFSYQKHHILLDTFVKHLENRKTKPPNERLEQIDFKGFQGKKGVQIIFKKYQIPKAFLTKAT